MRGDKTLQEFLYEDDKRRREENKKKKEELDKTRDLPKDKKFVNENCDKYVVQKFDREYEQAFQEISEAQSSSEEDEKAEEGKLTKKRFYKLLTYMGFVPQNLHNDAIERDLFEDFWGMVKGGASKETLRTALLAVIGVTLKDKIKDAEAPEKEQKKSPEHEGESEDENEEQEEKESPTEWGLYDEEED